MILRKLHSFRALFPIWIAVTVLGIALSPARLAAQAMDGASPAPTHTDNPLKEAHHAEKKSDEEMTLEYRHSATVQWLARFLHVDVETAALSFEYINFAVIALAIGIPLFKMLPKLLRKRSETLSQELESARTATADAKARLSAVEAKLAGLDAEIEAIRKQVDVEMHEDEARIKASIGEESARIVAAAEQEIGVAAALAQRELKQFAAGLAIDGALSRLTLAVETDKSLDSALIAEFAGRSGNQAGKAGQN